MAAFGLSLLGAVAPASAQQYRDTESSYRYRDTSQADVNAANQRLNDIYQRRLSEARAADAALRRNYRPRYWYSQETALRNAERLWISYRDADCRHLTQPYVGQRQHDGYLRGCVFDHINDRIAVLRQSRMNVGDNDRDQRWRNRYARTYTYTDDTYYQQCRNGPDPAGVIAGGLIGGLIGNIAGRDNNRTGGTIAGVVVGAAIGAALTSNMECEDRSYAYKSYYDGLNSGRANSDFDWRNQRNGNSGRFRVNQYYADDDGFRCATYTQTATINRRSRQTQGHACQQPDGAWVVLK